MKVLFQALYTLFAPVGVKPDIYNSLSGKLYMTEAPQNTDYPYCVYHLIGNYYDYTFQEDFEEFNIQLTLFDDNTSADNITTYFEQIKTLYDWSRPSVTGYDTVWFVREFAELMRFEDIWQYVTQYNILLFKQ